MTKQLNSQPSMCCNPLTDSRVVYNSNGYPELTSTNPKDLEGNKKPPLSLVPPSALIHLAGAFKEGAAKYGAYNWRTKQVQSMVYIDAMLRHLAAVIDGEDIDPESGKHHMDGVIASAAIYIDAMETGNLIDTRPVKGVAGKLIRKLSGKLTEADNE